MGFIHQTKVLLRKNFLVKRRNYKETMQEVLVPIYWIILLLVIKLGVPVKVLPSLSSDEIPTCDLLNRTAGKCFPSQSPSTAGNRSNLNTATQQNTTTSRFMLGYVTNGDRRAMKVISLISNRTSNEINYREFKSSEEMVSFYKNFRNSQKFGLGLVFENGSNGLAYSIRMPSENSPSVNTKIEDENRHGQCRNTKTLFIPNLCLANSYIVYGAATVQVVVDAAITQVETNISSGFRPPDVSVKMMPKDPYTPSLKVFSSSTGVYMVLAFTPYITILVVNLVREKEDKTKELMRIMGMHDSAFWSSWTITYSIIIFIGVLIMNAIAAAAKIFGGSSFILMVIIFYLFGLSIIAFSFMISPLFKNSKVAGTVTMLMNVVFGLLILPINALGASNAVKWALSLLSPTAFTISIAVAVEIGPGLQFDNIATKGSFPAINGIIMLIVDTIIYLLIALYLDAVIPGEFGRRREPLFFLKASFWKTLFGKKKKVIKRQLSAREQYSSEDVEPMPAELLGKEAISIHKIRKVFHGKEEVVAVDGVSLDIYEGHVTALLGHNGAGKTTLIATMTGMTPPTSGTISINGMDVTDPDDLVKIRKTIGVCPQQNVLFDYLTVKEHIEFYAGLKDVDGENFEDMVNSIVNEVDLEDQKDTLAKNLSGGQKRKLCVGMALVGNPKVVFLDEPTSGMDPYSRRQMWTLLRTRCKDRVMLLTTHFMDEADILADYKAILSKGKLRCAGSSLFLKNRFGIGYHLNMSLADGCNTEQLTEVVQGKIPGAEVLRHYGREMAFVLPMEGVSRFSELFAMFEENSESQEAYAASVLGVNSYGVSMTTLEEVFLQLEDTNEEEDKQEGQGQEEAGRPGVVNVSNLVVPATEEPLSVQDGGTKFAGSTSNLRTVVELNNSDIRKESSKPPSLLKQQLLGLLKIRWLNSKRSPMKIFFMMFIPPVLLTVGMVIMRTGQNTILGDETQSMAVTPSLYVTPASSEDYATRALIQNSTKHGLESILKQFDNYHVGYKEARSIGGILNTSKHDLVNLGFEIRDFPAGMTSYNKLSAIYRKYLMYYNNTMLHSIPVGLNILGSTFHMLAQQLRGVEPHPIETKIQFFPPLSTPWKYDSTAFISIMLIGMAFVFIPGGFAVEVVDYRQSNIRHMLRLSGVSPFVYWLHFAIADGLVFLAPVLLGFILVGAFALPSLSSAPALGCFALEVLFYLPSSLLFSYTMSFIFSKWETAQSVTPQLFGFLGFLPFLACSLVDMISSPSTAIIIHYVALVLSPPYALFGALYYIDRIYRFASIRAQSNDVVVPASEYFAWTTTVPTLTGPETQYNGVPAALLMPFIHCIIFSLLLYFLDQRSIGNTAVCSCCGSESHHRKPRVDRSLSILSGCSFRSIQHEDDDVMEEKQKIIQEDNGHTADSTHAVVVKGLWKRFGRKKKAKTVVKDLFFAVEQGEVFGLLGPNGAGKTTTLKMITKDVAPSVGQVVVAGYDISKDAIEAFQHMGYCPQADTLWKQITLEEHLEVFARIRGVPWGEVKTIVDHYLRGLKIAEHADKLSKALSGGTKRKLSFAIAMLGDPDLLLLDEPSTGMDPSSRRFLWDTISKNVQGKRGAILTTHSMEEADVLSSRVGIMVKGELKCVGSTQHLKSKFGSGYSLEVKLSHGNLQHRSEAADPGDDVITSGDPRSKLYQFVDELFPGAVRTESFGTRVMYKVPKDSVVALSKAFVALEKGKREVGIEEYSFSQSTLEQVFLEFAREQDDDRTGDGADDKTKSPPGSSSSPV